jgi:hypothetical protein
MLDLACSVVTSKPSTKHEESNLGSVEVHDSRTVGWTVHLENMTALMLKRSHTKWRYQVFRRRHHRHRRELSQTRIRRHPSRVVLHCLALPGSVRCSSDATLSACANLASGGLSVRFGVFRSRVHSTLSPAASTSRNPPHPPHPPQYQYIGRVAPSPRWPKWPKVPFPSISRLTITNCPTSRCIFREGWRPP